MKKIIRRVVYTLVALLVWAGLVFITTLHGWWHSPLTRQHTSQAFVKAVDARLDKLFVGQLAMAILKDGKVELEKFHTAGKPVDRHTVFQVASLSKWISAFGIMKLVEQKRIDLDAPVSTYLTRWQLPQSKFNNDEVTVRRLLSHTAGLTDGLGYSGFETPQQVQTIEQSLTRAADADEGISGSVHVGISPGSTFHYSGGGYTLLQLVVEEVSGQSFASYMKAHVFDPLGMTHSSYIWDESPAHSLADFYNSDGTKSTHHYYTALAATSLYTSLADLELFFQAHLLGKHNEPVGRTILKPETIKMMRAPHAQTMGVDIWGLGTVLYAATDENDFIIGHDGKSTPPVNTAIRLNPETGDGIIILETGHATTATILASEWVFWKTGKVDTFLFPMLTKGMVRTIGIGWIMIVGMAVFFSWRKKRLNR